MMVVRPVTEADNDALCRMELLAPQGTTIRLTERRFEFAARSRQFPGAVLYVAADDTSGVYKPRNYEKTQAYPQPNHSGPVGTSAGGEITCYTKLHAIEP
jgi:hypothetical protein